VARSTIYRHWATRDDVLFAAVEQCMPVIEPPSGELGFEDSLRALVAELRRTMSDPQWARVLPALLTLAGHEHGIADLEQRLEARQHDALEVVLRRGVDEGRLVPGIDVDEAVAVLVGPLTFAVLVGRPDLDEAFCERVVAAFLQAYAPGGSGSVAYL
jgi:AcrR family transcriptional regulator